MPQTMRDKFTDRMVRFGCLVERFLVVTSPVGTGRKQLKDEEESVSAWGRYQVTVMEGEESEGIGRRKVEQEAVDRQRCEMMTILLRSPAGAAGRISEEESSD
ncbi:hypothetical protein HPP92_008986 [Vanilla planifolia]|uniref:Uncharacterized protein n=1 Tax=Vanilla planifolia TaxID=51239 RepID=A0A835RET8_VANPL|nr:hypothetical protein HPP92_008986 [Vanilla planifolia]